MTCVDVVNITLVMGSGGELLLVGILSSFFRRQLQARFPNLLFSAQVVLVEEAG